jgi:hypothetical protein
MNTSRISKIITFLFIIIILDQTSGIVLRKLYFNQKAGPKHGLNYFFSECRDSIIILGNSRAQHNYNTRIISELIKTDSYNAGQDGGHSILLPYAQIEVLLRRFSPKLILLEIDSDGLEYRPQDYEKLSILLPYYKVYPELHSLILSRSPFERIKLLSGIYPYNSDIMNLIRYNTNTHSVNMNDIRGFIPITGRVLNRSMIKVTSESGTIQSVLDTNKIAALKSIIKLCREKNVKIILVSSPEFHFVEEKPKGQSFSALQFLEIIRSEKVHFIDLLNDPLFRGRMELFADIRHLNETGAAMFSQIIAGHIKKELSGISE